MADPVTTGLVIGGSSTVMSMSAQSAAADAQEEAYRKRAHQERVAAMNRTVLRQRNLKNVLSTQLALTAGRGVVPNQGSFQAIQSGAFEQFENDENADALNTAYSQENLEAQANIARQNANVGMAGSLLSFGTSAFNINRTPTYGH